MLTDLSLHRLGLHLGIDQTLELARRYGFDSVELDLGAVLCLDEDQQLRLYQRLKQVGLGVGPCTLPVDLRGDAARYTRTMHELPAVASKLAGLGCTALTAWLPPGSDRATFGEQMRTLKARLREVAVLLRAFGMRLGLEYVGAATAVGGLAHPGIRTLAQTRELLDAVDYDNVGLVLNAWQWHAAGDGADELLELRASSVVVVELADAQPGVAREVLQLGRTFLPGSTGVIDLRGFVGALHWIDYRGAVRAEVYNPEQLGRDPAVAVGHVARSLGPQGGVLGTADVTGRLEPAHARVSSVSRSGRAALHR